MRNKPTLLSISQKIALCRELIYKRLEEEGIDESKISVTDQSIAEFHEDGSIKSLGHANVIDWSKHDMDFGGLRKKTMQEFYALAKIFELDEYPSIYEKIEKELEVLDYDRCRYRNGIFHSPDLIVCYTADEIIEEEKRNEFRREAMKREATRQAKNEELRSRLRAETAAIRAKAAAQKPQEAKTLQQKPSSTVEPTARATKNVSSNKWFFLLWTNALAVIMLGVGICDISEYGYYTLLRIVIFLLSLWAAYRWHILDKPVLFWLFLGLAILFNPIIPVHLDKDIWQGIDFVALMAFVVDGYYQVKLAGLKY